MASDAGSIASSLKIKQEEPDVLSVVSRRKKSSQKDPNRPKKRSLVRWDDDLDKQVLLTVQWACNERGLKIPFDLVAETLGNGVTEGAIVQHLAKLRGKMIKAEIPVPPAIRRGTVAKEPSKIYANTNGKKLPPPVFATMKAPLQAASRKQTGPKSHTTSKSKPKSKPKSKNRGKRTRSDLEDSEEDVFNDYIEKSDNDYGAVKKKSRTSKPRAKVGRSSILSTRKSATNNRKTRRAKLEAADTEEINQDILLTLEDAGPASRTRHVKQDFNRLEQNLTDEEEEEDNEENDDFEMPVVFSPTDVKDERSISPRTMVPNSGFNVVAWSQGVTPDMVPPNSITGVKGNDVDPAYQMAAATIRIGNGTITPSSSRNPSMTSLAPSLLNTPGPHNFGRSIEQHSGRSGYIPDAYGMPDLFSPTHYHGACIHLSAISPGVGNQICTVNPGVNDLGLGLGKDSFDINAPLLSTSLDDDLCGRYAMDDTFLKGFNFDS